MQSENTALRCIIPPSQWHQIQQPILEHKCLVAQLLNETQLDICLQLKARLYKLTGQKSIWDCILNHDWIYFEFMCGICNSHWFCGNGKPKEFRRIHWLLRNSYFIDDVHCLLGNSGQAEEIFSLPVSVLVQSRKNHFSTCGQANENLLCVTFLAASYQQSTVTDLCSKIPKFILVLWHFITKPSACRHLLHMRLT